MWISSWFRSRLQEFTEIATTGLSASALAPFVVPDQCDVFETKSDHVTAFLNILHVLKIANSNLLGF